MTTRKRRGSMPPAGDMRRGVSVGEGVRCAAMDCEAGRPRVALLVWEDETGRVHKRAWPEGDPLLEEGLLCAMDRLGLGSTPDETPRV